MFTKQNTKQKVYKTKLKLCLQNKTKVYIQVMFIKQVIFTKQKCTDQLCKQNKTKVYIQVMFIKQVMSTKSNTKQNIY